MTIKLLNILDNPLMLVIDMQNICSRGQKWECLNFDRAIDKIKRLLDQCPTHQIIFTRYIASEDPFGIWKDYNRENSYINHETWLNELVDDLKSIQNNYNYKCYDKSVYSSLSIKHLYEVALKASCVIITGVVAECCVLSTVMSLIDAGVYVIYLKDAVAGVNNDTEKATITVLEGLSPLHLCLLNTDEYLNLIEKY